MRHDARFINVPELMQMFRQVADVQTAAMLDLPRPKLEGEKPAIRNAPATPELKAFVQELAARAERFDRAGEQLGRDVLVVARDDDRIRTREARSLQTFPSAESGALRAARAVA